MDSYSLLLTYFNVLFCELGDITLLGTYIKTVLGSVKKTSFLSCPNKFSNIYVITVTDKNISVQIIFLISNYFKIQYIIIL